MRHLREFVTQLQLAGISLKQGELMCRHTTFQIGGPVAVMTFPTSFEQVGEIMRLAREFQVCPMVLGAGSNLLAPDSGLDAVMLETRTGLCRITERKGGILEAQSGVTLARLATFAMERGFTGLEFAHGIPGTLGGGVYMNAGAYGGELKQVVEAVTVMHRNGKMEELLAEDLDLSYRHSRFMEEDCVILSAKLRLQKGNRDEIRATMSELMRRRRESQPLEYPSAGSTFKRPANGYAAALIEEAGLKGLTVGGAQVSKKHAGFIVNTGRATSEDVTALMAQVQERVQAYAGIRLEPEVRILRSERGCDF